ncbi:MAG: hypothetical protein J6U05_01050, partial [Neisseriaceae bacterium]|nr:hypothetical protein [Neisseriaceae bacterium]
MIDENPYAPPKSVLEDFGQPEMIVKPTKMQRLFRVVLFPVLLPVIATVLYSIIHLLVAYLGIDVSKFKIAETPKTIYFVFSVLTMLQSIIFSLILEFSLLNNRNKNTYSLWGGFLIGFSAMFFAYIVIVKGVVNKRDITELCMMVVTLTYSSYLISLILNRHISYYNKKNRSGSLKLI